MRSSPSLIVVSRFATMGLSLVSAPIVARGIGPEGRGLAASGLAFSAILPVVVAVGLPVVVRQYAARGEASDVLRRSRQITYAALPFCLAIGAVFADLVLGGRLTVGETASFLTMSAAAALYAHALCDQSVLISESRFLSVAVLQGIQVMTAFAITLGAFLLSSLAVTTIFLGQAVGCIATWCYGVVVVASRSDTQKDSNVSRRDLIADGLRYYPSQILDIASVRLDQVLMIPVMGPVQSGYYAVAVTIGTVPIAFGHAIGTAAFQAVAKSSPIESLRVTGQILRGSVVLGTVLGLGMACSFPTLVPVVFGAEFSGAVSPALLIAAGAPALIANYVAGQCLAARARPRAMMIASGLGLTIGVGGLIAFGGEFGAAGAASAFLVGQLTILASAALMLGLRRMELVPRPSDITRVVRLLRRGV